MSEPPRIYVLYTGGTIGMAGRPLAPMPAAHFEALLGRLPGFAPPWLTLRTLGGEDRRVHYTLDALDDTSRELFMALREERTALARERSVPPYVICHDRTLLGLAVQRPTTDGGLAGVHGMGPARIEAYGARLIAVIERSVGLS